MQCIEAAATCLEAGLEAEISHTVDALRNHPGMVLQAYEEAKHTGLQITCCISALICDIKFI